MSERFQVGDVVRLKSGGPKMTVSMIDNDGLVHVKWFDGEVKVQQNYFASAALEKDS